MVAQSGNSEDGESFVAAKWTYKLRILKKNPDQMPLERLASYMAEFAALLGPENGPVFAGIHKASTGLAARIPGHRHRDAALRLHSAASQPGSRPARHLKAIEQMLGSDGLPSAQLLNAEGKVVYLIAANKPAEVDAVTLQKSGEIDGVVTGLVGADDTMHLHVRNRHAKDVKLIVRDEGLARELLKHFRAGQVRIKVHGSWVRTEHGWVPENNRCTVESFEVLSDASLGDVLGQIAGVDGNGWCGFDDPQAVWRDLRGIH